MAIILCRRLALLAAALFVFAAPVCRAADADLARATLENGLRVVIQRNTLAPAAAIELSYLAGSVEAPPGFPGMAHAQEHMMFRGSPGLSPAQLSAIMAGVGGESNAATQQVVTQYTATVAVEDLDAVLHVEAIRMAGVLDSEEAWGEERGAIEQEVEQDLSNPEYLLYVKLLGQLFADTPYQHDALGSRASFDQTTGEMLRKFHRDWYAPNNAVLVIVGDLDPHKTLEEVRGIFGGIPARPLPPRPEVRLQPLRPAHFDLDSNLPYGLALVAYRLPGFDSPDFAAGQVLGDVLESQRGNLYALVPEGKALTTDFEGLTLPKAGAGVVTAAFPQGGDGTALLARVRRIVADYLKSGFPPELVAAAKRHEVAQLEFGKGSLAGLASTWSQAVAVEGRRAPEDDIEAVKRVTPEDVNRVARAWLKDDTAVTALLVPRPSGNPVPAKGFARAKESFATKNAEPVTLPRWAARLSSLPEEVRGSTPSVFTLGNGLRLVVVESRTSDAVAVYGEVKHRPELATPRAKDGVDELLGSLFSYGTTRMDRLAFQTALDDIAAEESAGTGFSLRVLKGSFDRGVELLADNLLHPALPPTAFKVIRGQTAEALVGELQSPGWLAEEALAKGLYPRKDPKLRHPTPTSVRGLTLEDVKRYYRRVFRPDLTTIVVVGAVAPETARATIERYFGAWRATGPRPATELPPVPRNRERRVSVPDLGRTQAEVTLAETLGLTRTHPDYYPLQVGLRVLSGGFYATRLDRELREKNGLVYTVEAFLEAGTTRSLFGVYYGCDPKEVDKARRLVEKNLLLMQGEDVSPAELLQAKTMLLRQMLLARTSALGVAEEILHLVQLGLPLDEPLRASERYRQVSAPQVKKAFARWIRPSGFVQVIRGPAP